MNTEELRKIWENEEKKARINGWDFSYIEGRFSSGDDELPWDMIDVINRYRRSTDRLLDIDTGGGEFLLSLGHPYSLTSATEGYPPNVELCRKKLGGLGIDFRAMTDYSAMPFPDASFDIVTDRHGSYDISEIFRVLRPGGVFITQQVGQDNDRELVEKLLPGVPYPYPGHDLKKLELELKNSGFSLLESNEVHRRISFYDTGALVWFARIIEWEFIEFSVEKCFEQLLAAEKEIQQTGSVNGRIHRFYAAARKP